MPTLIIAGPLLAQLVHRWVPIEAGNAGAVAQMREGELATVGATSASGGSGETAHAGKPGRSSGRGQA